MKKENETFEILALYVPYIAQEKKLFFHGHSSNKNSKRQLSQIKLCKISSKFVQTIFSLWVFAEELCEILWSFSVKFLADTPRKHI